MVLFIAQKFFKLLFNVTMEVYISTFISYNNMKVGRISMEELALYYIDKSEALSM